MGLFVSGIECWVRIPSGNSVVRFQACHTLACALFMDNNEVKNSGKHPWLSGKATGFTAEVTGSNLRKFWCSFGRLAQFAKVWCACKRTTKMQ